MSKAYSVSLAWSSTFRSSLVTCESYVSLSASLRTRMPSGSGHRNKNMLSSLSKWLPRSPNWRTRWCITQWPRICLIARGSTSYVCESCTHSSRTEIFSDWERTSSSGLRARAQSSLHIWKTSDFVDWPQTSDIDLQEASRFSSKASTEISVTTPAVWCWPKVQAWLWNVPSWHPI